MKERELFGLLADIGELTAEFEAFAPSVCADADEEESDEIQAKLDNALERMIVIPAARGTHGHAAKMHALRIYTRMVAGDSEGNLSPGASQFERFVWSVLFPNASHA